jgi:nitrate/nitrite-specific signal transduction histidine kinase
MNNKYMMYLFYGFIISIFSILIFTGYYFSRIQVDDGVRINLAGRQRMLSQQIFKEILLFKIGEISPDKIKKTMRLFTETENALIYGGAAPVDMEFKNFRILPGIKDKNILAGLMDVKTEWGAIEKNIVENITKGDNDSLRYILSHSDTLLTKIDNSVSALQIRSEKNNMIMGIIILCSFLIITVLLAVNFIKKIKDLRSAGERIKKLETLLPICSSCKKIRIDNEKPMEPESWTTIEHYLHEKKDMTFTHGICPDCMNKLYPGILESMKK